MGNRSGTLSLRKSETSASTQSAASNIPTEPTVHGVTFLADFHKKPWRRQEIRKLRRSNSTRRESQTDGNVANGNANKDGTDGAKKHHVNGRVRRNTSFVDETISDSDQRLSDDSRDVDTGTPEWLSYHGYPYENVILSGGGSKGYSYIGALKALEDCGILKNMKRVAGSSAGAICAGLLAVGCSPQEIADVFKCDIKWLFQDQQCALCCSLPRVCRKYGIHPAKRFNKIYGRHIANKVGNADITFKQLYEEHGKELCVVVTNLSRMCSEYCHPKTTPDLPIRAAVRMSMSFPLVYKAVRCELNGRVSLYTDGGMLDQYPIQCFDGSTLDMNHNTQDDEDGVFTDNKFNDKSLGLYVISEKAIDHKIWRELFEQDIPYRATYLPNTKLARERLKMEVVQRKKTSVNFDKKEYLSELRSNTLTTNTIDILAQSHYETCNKSQVDISNFGAYFITAIETLLVCQRKLRIKPHDYWRTVAINCGYIGTNDYDIEIGDREFMIRQGYAHTRRFLRDFIDHKRQGTYMKNRHSLRRTQTVPANMSHSAVPTISGSQLSRTLSTLETQV